MSVAIHSWAVQLRKGAAEIAVLSLLRDRPLSGVGLVEKLEHTPEVGIAEGSIYPLLARLEREGRISGDWRPSPSGARSQKVYQLTHSGKDALAEMIQVWTGFQADLSRIITGYKDG